MTAPTLPEWQNFMLGSVSPALAVLFSNPFEVAKVRKQMDGELRTKTSGVYRGTLGTLRTIYAHEGFRGLQAGLSISILREGSKNLFRIGAYLPVLRRIHRHEDGPAPVSKRLLAGAISGGVGALVCNPIEIIKTRLQAEASHKLAQATGRAQFGYTGMVQGFNHLYHEMGLLGMWKYNVGVSILRSAVVTSINLTSYTMMKERAHSMGIKETPILHVGISLISAFLAIVGNNPLDVIRNRMYNQKVPLYKNTLDAIIKISRVEGPTAFYKGFWQHYMRSAPHFVLTFVFFEQFKQVLIRRQHAD